MLDWIWDHPYEIVGTLIALLTLVLAWFQYRKKDAPVPSMALKESCVSHSPIISGSHNQVFVGGASSAQTVEPAKDEHPVPNLTYAGPEQRLIFIGEWANDGIREPHNSDERENSVPALVFKFENRIRKDRKISKALNVIAKVRFHHPNGATQHAINYGVWLDSPCNSTDFGVSDIRELVIMCEINNTLVTFRDKRVGNLRFDTEEFSYLEQRDVTAFDRVEIILVDQNSQTSLSIKSKIWREGSAFCSTEI